MQSFWPWAARYNTWLLIKLPPKGVVFSFLFYKVFGCKVCGAQALVDHQHMQGGQVPAGNVVHVQVMLLQYLHSLPGFGVLSLGAPAVAVCVCWMMCWSDQCVCMAADDAARQFVAAVSS